MLLAANRITVNLSMQTARHIPPDQVPFRAAYESRDRSPIKRRLKDLAPSALSRGSATSQSLSSDGSATPEGRPVDVRHGGTNGALTLPGGVLTLPSSVSSARASCQTAASRASA